MLRTVISALSIAITFKMCFLLGAGERTRCPPRVGATGTREATTLPRLTRLKRSDLLGGQRVGQRIDFGGKEAAARGFLSLAFTFKTGPEDRIDSLLRVGGG